GYHQIQMAEEDQEKTVFITAQGTYCYNVMPFRLKNARATYQRLVNKIFARLIGHNIEAYVDNMVVKSGKTEDHVSDLKEVFEVLRANGMKLNPSKCSFGTSSEKFLGFMVTQRGIEVNPKKVEVILQMKPPTSTKEIQRLNGRITALSCFLSRSGDRCIPFL